MASTHNTWCFRRFLAFMGAVTKHWYALIAMVLGGFLISSPAWLKPVLEPYCPNLVANYIEETSRLTQPVTYSHWAIGFVTLCFICACYLAWNEEHDALETRQSELASLIAITNANCPELTFVVRSLWFSPHDETNETEMTVRVDLLILNSGQQTSLHSWEACAHLKEGRTVRVSEEWHFDSAIQHDPNGNRNLFTDDDMIMTGGKRTGWIKFQLHDTQPLDFYNIRQVTLGCYDTDGEFYEINGPDLGQLKYDNAREAEENRRAEPV